MTTLATSISVDGRNAIIASPRYTTAFRKANSIFCPLGRAASRAWLLMTRADLAAISSNPSIPKTITWTHSGGLGISQLKFQGFYLHKSTRVLHGGVADNNSIHLVEFVDARAIAAAHSDTGKLHANIRAYAKNTINDAAVRYLDTTSGFTWTSLATQLWQACPGLGDWPGLPYAPDGVPQNFRFIGNNAWEALCTLLDKLDCAVAHNPLTGSYSIVSLGATQSIPDEPLTLKWNAEPNDFPAADIPHTVRVYFHSHYDSYGQERDTERTTNWSVSGFGDYIDVATGEAGAVGGTIKTLWDDLPRLYGEDNTLTNGTELNARAENRKSKWVQRQKTTRRHRIHIGLSQSFLPGPQIRAVLWRCWGSKSEGLQELEAGTVTEFICGPELITSLGAHGLSDTPPVPNPSAENLAAPDLGRHSYPNFPRLPNAVQVYHSAGSQGQQVSANASGLHPGKVRRWVAGALAELEDCWIRFVDEHDTRGGNVSVKDGDVFIGRLSGIETSGATTLPIYLARKGGDEQNLVRFKLTEDLLIGGDRGGRATAKMRLWDEGTQNYVDGSDIIVHDWWQESLGGAYPGTSDGTHGMWQATSGMEGWARKREGTTVWGEQETDVNYDIVWMETYAWAGEGTAKSDIDKSSVPWKLNIDANKFFEQGLPPAAVLDVYDYQSFFPHALEGGKVKVTRSEYDSELDDNSEEVPINPSYRTVNVQQMGFLATATLAEPMCSTGTFDLVEDSFRIATFSPFNLAPPEGIASCVNPRGHLGEAGDEVVLMFHQDIDQGDRDWWEVIDVTKKKKTFVTQVRFNGGCWQYKTLEVAVEYCDEQESDWIDITCGDPCIPSST